MEEQKQKYLFVALINGYNKWDPVPGIELTDETTFGEFMQAVHSLNKHHTNFRIFAEGSPVDFRHNIYMASKRGEDLTQPSGKKPQQADKKQPPTKDKDAENAKDLRIKELETANHKALYRINILIRAMDETDQKIAQLQVRFRENLVKERAYQIWKENGESDMEKNYYQAEQELSLPTGLK